MIEKIAFVLMVLSGTVLAAEDMRQLATLPTAAEATLREEMRGNMIQLNEIISLAVAGKVKDAGKLAEKELGTTAMGRNRSLPMDARPGPYMPAAMHAIGMEGHKAASAFAAIAATGDRKKTLAALPMLTGSCVSCHNAYRIR